MSTYKPLPLLIAVSGKLGSGKDYIAEHFLLPMIKGTVSKMAFADQIKINVASQEPDIDLIQCLQGNKNAELRRKLQIAGTEKGRDIYGPDIWVTTLENWIRLRQLRDGAPDVVLVTDCRFLNEAKWIEDNNGLLIRVEAPSRNEFALRQESKGDQDTYNSIKDHPSETALDNFAFLYRINNEPRSDQSMSMQVCSLLIKYLSKHPEYCWNFA
jgi:hypothetical protein